jgi:hypothetical protein
MRGLDGILRYTVTTPEGKKEFKKFSLTELSEESRKQYLQIAEKIKRLSSGISISPIDIIVQKLKAAGYTVAEVTGRKYEVQINTKNNKGLVRSRNRINTNDAFRQFNNNEVDVLMINQSGSTGASAHAIVTKKVSADEVRQRVMIVLQAELDINTEVQKTWTHQPHRAITFSHLRLHDEYHPCGETIDDDVAKEIKVIGC